MKRRTITVNSDDFKILSRAKAIFEKNHTGRITWGGFLQVLGLGYLVGTGVIKLEQLAEKRKQKKEVR